MVDHNQFTYRLEPLPDGQTVSLSEALEFAWYGGVLAVQHDRDAIQKRVEHLVGESEPIQELIREGKEDKSRKQIKTISRELIEGLLSKRFVDDGRHVIDIKDHELGIAVRMTGPQLGEIAKPGAILFGVTESEKEDELCAAFERAFCKAARAGQLAICGRAFQGVMAGVHPEHENVDTDLIIATYFASWRGLNVLANGIDAVSVFNRGAFEKAIVEANATIRDPKTEKDVPKYTSYANVSVDRAQFIEFLKIHYPAVVDNQQQAAPSLTNRLDIAVLAFEELWAGKRRSRTAYGNKDVTIHEVAKQQGVDPYQLANRMKMGKRHNARRRKK